MTLSTTSSIQHAFPFAEAQTESVPVPLKDKRTGAFTDNMRLPIHRWFRYSAGFSAEWAERTVASAKVRPDRYVLDPFAGSGTTLIAAAAAGARSVGIESHSFVSRIAKAKLSSNLSPQELLHDARAMIGAARSVLDRPQATDTPALLSKCYAPATLERLEALRCVYLSDFSRSNSAPLLWLALTAILRECSPVATAQWQYILPAKSKAKSKEPFGAFENRAYMFAADLIATKSIAIADWAKVVEADARNASEIANLRGAVDLVLTSPPYPNNYDYADATRLEMTFWREVGGWADLQPVIRQKLIRSCSQHSAAEKLKLEELIERAELAPIRTDLWKACASLAEIRETRGGKKTYHTMVAAYFLDLARVWTSLRALCAPDSVLCFVVGDSAPYGVHIPVEEWLARLAVAAGFQPTRFEKIRDRNTKWKNRKHRVPLKEGNLWLKG